MTYTTLARNPLQRRLLDLEQLQTERRQTELLERWKQGVDDAPDRLQTLITIVWYWIAQQPGGPTEADMEATLRLLRGQTAPRRYRLLIERAESALDAAERGEPGPVFGDVARWLDLSSSGGKGPHGAALTW